MSRLPRFDRNDLKRWLGEAELAKARDYIERVDHLEIRPPRITASVQGTGPFPYRVAINLDADKHGNPRLVGGCSCPVGWMCKHVAAVMLHLLERPAAPDGVRSEVLSWLEGFGEAARPSPAKARKANAPAAGEVLCYALHPPTDARDDWSVRLYKARRDAQGRFSGKLTPWSNVERALVQPPRFVADADLVILRALWAQRTRGGYEPNFPLRGQAGDECLRLMLASGRLLARVTDRRPLAAGEPRAGTPGWQLDGAGETVFVLQATPPIQGALVLNKVWYIDGERHELGELTLDAPAPVIARLLALPALNARELALVAGALRQHAPQLPAPATPTLRSIDVEPRCKLALGTLEVIDAGRYRGYRYGERLFDFLLPTFHYDEVVVQPGQRQEYFVTAQGETVHVRRRMDRENARLAELARHGVEPVPANTLFATRPRPPHLYGLESPAHWPAFMAEDVPALRAAGWQVEMAPDFRHLVLDVQTWDAQLEEDEGGWFSLDMGIVVDGRRLPLAPLLYELFKRDVRWLDADSLARIADDAPVILTTADGTRLRMPAGRIKPLARTLIDLFDAPPGDGPLRLSRLDAPRLEALNEGWRIEGMAAVTRFARELRQADGVRTVPPPAGLALTPRPYQLEGLAWLQYLREHGLAGILADDMGLGKTAQTLAHLLLEKEAGRMDRPSLVVLPTSLIFNWKREAARFAPDLRVLSLHGPERAERFADIPDHDVILTTYPLLWRDEEALARHDYHLLILDEAQTVKNAASHAARVVRTLRARHRLCLTGTPLENHLGELWAQFDFLLPGFLGDAKSFTKTWRTPIEKHGDRLRRDLLAARVKPFILRRRKQDVARELPPKTVIVRSVELEGGQRDLYETVRSAMDEKVREAIAAQGFARSQIVILDALLKLRQVCCDPRLVKLDAAKKVKERAKLDQLMDMLPELVDEGRRILVFSQFTSMLELIERELVRRELGHVLLTGETRDREAAIRRFQDGEVPIFLISLKAGGVGLNLTAADTVIHYDPWWNPAVENQATDRAHRLGQDKNVFVYKLVVAGSIEEKILALQEKKAELAAGVLSEDAAALSKFGEADIQALLAPLPVDGPG
jgi:superfamily II DNA or RNA helicase